MRAWEVTVSPDDDRDHPEVLVLAGMTRGAAHRVGVRLRNRRYGGRAMVTTRGIRARRR